MLVRLPPSPASAAVVWQLGTAAPAARRELVEAGVVPSAVEAKEVAWQVALET